MSAQIRVTGLNIYPLKSARGIAVREMPLDARGPAGDRRWMLVNPKGTMISQRELPRMALIAVEGGSPELACTAPGMPPLRVPVPERDPTQRISATVWASTVEVQLSGDGAHAWFCKFLGADCRLVYQPDDSFRQVNRFYAAEGVGVSLADGFPLLLIGQGSLEALNARLETPVEMRRFRPNVVVSSTEPFAEDSWRRIGIGEVEFSVVKPCARCAIPTVDPDTGVMGKEPMRTLANFRLRNNNVFFGENLLHHSHGTLRLNDSLSVLESRAE